MKQAIRTFGGQVILRSGLAWVSAMLAISACAFPGETLPVSVGLQGFGPFGNSSNPSVSADGRYIAFESDAPDLVAGDTNGKSDIFVTDRLTGQTVRASVGIFGEQAYYPSIHPSISADGRFVAFESAASNLVAGDTNGRWDIFVRDLVFGTTARASVDSAGMQENDDSRMPSLSAGGRFLAFESFASNLVSGDTNGTWDIFVRDLATGSTNRVSISSGGAQGNGISTSTSISPDGRFVAFESNATNLVDGDTNSSYDVFVRDLSTGTTALVSVDSAGAQANHSSSSASISSDGRFVAFASGASNLVVGDTNGKADVFVRDVNTGKTIRASVGSGGVEGNNDSGNPSISADGRYIAFESYAWNLVPGDSNDMQDVFLRDVGTDATTRVSVDSAGVQGNISSSDPSISGDGRLIVFHSYANNLVPGDMNATWDVFLRDVGTDATTRVSVDAVGAQANSDSDYHSISADGRYVAFSTLANNLLVGDTNAHRDVFVRDLITGTTTRVSVDSAGDQANFDSYGTSISADGRYVAFDSDASNLVPGDTGGTDVFVRDLVTGTTNRVSLDSFGAQGNSSSAGPSISADGRYVAFGSSASNLVSGDTNGWKDIFVRDLITGTTSRVSLDSAGLQSNNHSDSPSISANGRFVAFGSDASNLVPGDTNGSRDVFVRDLNMGTTTRVSLDSAGAQGNNGSPGASISSDGRFVAFVSSASNLVPGDTNGGLDVFVRDRSSSKTTRVSVSSFGAQGNNSSYEPSISANGRFVAFVSRANNLVTDDTNGMADVFLRDLLLGTTTRVSVDSAGVQGNNTSIFPSISADGRFVAFTSSATNLTSFAKYAGSDDVFRHEVKLANTISGKVTIPGFAGGLPKTWVDFSLEPVGGGDPIPISYVKMKDDGSYSFSTGAQGSFRILARAPGSLVKAFASTISLGSATLANVDFTLTLGDCDGNNYIGTDDYLILNSAFDTNLGDAGFDPRADLNGDGYVGTDDYLLLNAHFDESGD